MYFHNSENNLFNYGTHKSSMKNINKLNKHYDYVLYNGQNGAYHLSINQNF